MTRIKVCCISSLEEARTAINMGAHALGLVGPMPSGPGIISNELIAEIAHAVRDEDVRTFLLTSETEADAIIAHYRKCKTTTIQLVDAVENEVYAKLRSSLPEVELVQVIHVLDENSINEALEKAAFVDYILLDSGNPNLQTKELGGTGRTHNWSISKRSLRSALYLYSWPADCILETLPKQNLWLAPMGLISAAEYAAKENWTKRKSLNSLTAQMARTKNCPNCKEDHSVMFRVQYKPSDKTWYFLCEKCVLEVKPGNSHYRYGGTWKG